ncbi:8-amino-7-oxononanoate synthase [Pelosinus propionicus]|uniref:8-amino-7-ketopelargonate synthase n=1 Tax=Pelosinus propionicus DSM 13327 TaxID=1123291 RepID=A0A1I4HWV4_9FIRM|nr:8-amino-7-oxononanoate synthase [Pelosinus propionicus]SFL46207.1 glycine C-acetyltransferase [Pelosinus propionicus DSM 13327]
MEFCKTHLLKVQEENLYRKPVRYRFLDAVHVELEGKTYLSLSTNNYLGLTHSSAVQQAAIDAIFHYGTGSGGARLTTGSHPLYQELEEELAAFKKTEAAVVFNAGYMANVGVISALVGRGDIIFSDELNHASIIDGCCLSRAHRVVYRHGNIDDLAEKLKNTPCSGRRLIVTDGVFSMDGDIAPLNEIAALGETYEAMIMVDDAHAVGILGRGGCGTTDHFGLQGRIHIQMGTLSKSLASEGGYVAGSQVLIDYLINKARSFIFSTALSPATVGAAHGALLELQNHPELVETVLQNAQYVREALASAGVPVEGSITPILPIMVGEAARAVEMVALLKDEGLLVSAIRPPTVPSGSSRLRLTISAAHDRKELAKAVESIIAVSRRVKLSCKKDVKR